MPLGEFIPSDPPHPRRPSFCARRPYIILSRGNTSGKMDSSLELKQVCVLCAVRRVWIHRPRPSRFRRATNSFTCWMRLLCAANTASDAGNREPPPSVRNTILAGTCSDRPRRFAAYAPVGWSRNRSLPASALAMESIEGRPSGAAPDPRRGGSQGQENR